MRRENYSLAQTPTGVFTVLPIGKQQTRVLLVSQHQRSLPRRDVVVRLDPVLLEQGERLFGDGQLLFPESAEGALIRDVADDPVRPRLLPDVGIVTHTVEGGARCRDRAHLNARKLGLDHARLLQAREMRNASLSWPELDLRRETRFGPRPVRRAHRKPPKLKELNWQQNTSFVNKSKKTKCLLLYSFLN